jgi:2-methylcitrate dehydratase
MPSTAVSSDTAVLLPADSNQARGIADFALDFMSGAIGEPADSVLRRTEMFHTDATLCGLSALALKINAPTILRAEALDYAVPAGRMGATVFGSKTPVAPEKAVVANSSAVREWDSNGTNFGFHASSKKRQAGEFGHNDFYPVAIAAAQMRGLDGAAALRGMILIDEIRGRLAEVFSLKTYKIDHVVHGAIGSAATFGAMMGATAEQIESAIGMVVAHYIPWRAIRAGKQLSDSKGASAAISTEVAVLSALRAMRGFRGPKDIFRNPEAIFRFFEPTTEGAKRWTELAPSPFDLSLSHSGDDFAVMGMHFKLGLYEHQSAGALQAIIDMVASNPHLLDDVDGGAIKSIKILAYEPAFGIIGNPAKMDPKTRQSADHSMAYIVSTLLRKALEMKKDTGALPTGGDADDAVWKALMLSPFDYDQPAVHNKRTRALMQKITFEHGGPEYDRNYPDGIPTSVVVTDSAGRTFDSGMVMYPAGHARNTTADLEDILAHKFNMLGAIGGDAAALTDRFGAIGSKSAAEIAALNDFPLADRPGYED